MTEPDDRELERYLQGDSALSRRYREGSRETAPPELDEAILAQARREVRRRPPRANRWLASIALAASVVLGVNLGWNVYRTAPPPGEAAQANRVAEADAPVPAASPPASAAQPHRQSPAAPEPFPQGRDTQAARATEPAEQRRSQGEAARKADSQRLHRERAEVQKQEQEQEQDPEQGRQLRAAEEPQRPLADDAAPALRRDALAGAAADADGAASAPAAPAPMSEAEKIDRLIRYVSGLEGVEFIRNDKVHTPIEAAKHMRLKRDKAGDRVRTADDFIRLCASFSSMSGEAYLMRFPDGRTRTAEDVLREQLARLEQP